MEFYITVYLSIYNIFAFYVIILERYEYIKAEFTNIKLPKPAVS